MIKSLKPITLLNIPFTIDEAEIIRELRLPKYKSLKEIPEENIAKYIKKAIDIGYTLISGKGVYRTVKIEKVFKDHVTCDLSTTLFQGSNMVKLLKKCDYATLLVCTMGPEFEKKIDEIKEDEPAEAFYLDRIGAWMADYFADPVEKLIETEINKNGYQKTFRFGVGYGDWKLPVQAEVLKVTEAHKIGVTHNEAFIMDPRFSVSALIGWERKAEKKSVPGTNV
ncbi:MAG: hypothetical protein HY200_01130 [Nitrospirae bacterium]|nr:hypothetical protein [Nitrospirota bacterium]MBI3593539.1 hypothetical protein [Nitrospirota bacterium]